MCRYFTLADLNKLECDNENFSILNYNIRSFHKNGNCLQSLLGSINLNFNCIILSETWNTELNYNLCTIPEYESFHTYRPKDHIYSRSGGISLFCSKGSLPQKNSTLSICNSNIETCVVDLIFNKIKITVIAVYRPPQGCKREFIQELDHILNSVNSSNSRIAIAGDMNINLYDIDDVFTLEYTSKLFTRSMISLINKPTRFPNTENISNPSILDHIWTNCMNVSNSGIIYYDVSDHLPTFCSLNFPSITENNEKIKIESRPFTEINLQKLINELEKINWDSLLNFDDPENSFATFAEKLNFLYMKCFPVKIKFISTKRYINKWLTHEVKKLIDKKSESFKKFRNGLITRAENNRLKNHINAQVNKAKNKYYTETFYTYRKNMKKSCSLLQDLMGTKKSKREITCLLDEDELSCTEDIVNKFANFFSTVGSNLDSRLEHSDLSPSTYVSRNPHSFQLFPVTPDECLKVISIN